MSLLFRLSKIVSVPIKKLYANLDHVKYAHSIGVHMGENVHIYGSSYKMFSTNPWLITIGNNVHITDGCLFITHDGGTLVYRDKVPDLEITKPIVVGDDVYLGVRTMILPGVKIGSRVVIGAGSIVTHDIPDNSVAVGVPARVIKTGDEYFEKLKCESLHLGHMKGKEKDKALQTIYKGYAE